MNKLQNIRTFVLQNKDTLCTKKNVITLLFGNIVLSFWVRFLIEQQIKYSAYHYSYFYMSLSLIPFAIFLMFNFEHKKASCFLFMGISMLNVSIIFNSLGLDFVFIKGYQSYKYFQLYDILSCTTIIITILLLEIYSIEKSKNSLLCPIGGCCAIIVSIIILIIMRNVFLVSLDIKIILPFFASFSLLFGILSVLEWYYMVRYFHNSGIDD